MPRLNHKTQIRWQSTVIGRPSCLVIFVRFGDVVGEFAGTLLDFAFVVGLGVVFVLLGHYLHLIDCVGGANKDAPGYARNGVA